jgi:hypothetical protein
MMAKRNHNRHPFTQSGVLARLTDMAGVRYPCYKLAQAFKVGSHEMMIMLNRMIEREMIRVEGEGVDRRYWMPTATELELAGQERYIKPFQPLVGYEQKMRRFAEMAEKGR